MALAEKRVPFFASRESEEGETRRWFLQKADCQRGFIDKNKNDKKE